MHEPKPFHERRPRIAGTIGGLVLSPIIAIVAALFLPLNGNIVNVVGLLLASATACAIVGALLPRIGKLALHIGGNLFSNLN